MWLTLFLACGDTGLVAEGRNDPPVVTIASPTAGTQVLEGEALTLEASATDPDGDDALIRIFWSSSLDGPLQDHVLRPGLHTLVALAVDGEGGVGVAEVQVSVVDPDLDDDGHLSVLWGGQDCRDDHPGIHPDAEDGCDSVDNDCDGAVDEAAPVQTWYPDSDNDGHGAHEPTWETCKSPEGWSLVNDDCDDTDNSRIHCRTCEDLQGGPFDQGDGTYTIDPLGGQPFDVFCNQSQFGGGWTLIATNGGEGIWLSHHMVSDGVFGTPSLTTSHKSPAWASVRFTDVFFENGATTAVYQDVDLGDRHWQEFQEDVPFYNCGEPNWALADGNFDHPNLCGGDTNLYLHPVDQDGGIYGACVDGQLETYADDGYGPTWNRGNNNGCPMDDPAGSGFHSPSMWGNQPLRWWVR